LRELGAGGMGTVFEAFEEKMNRKVALKLLSRHLSSSEKAGDRFAREAWIAGKLNHPNLVKVFERGEMEEVAYFSMELVDGGSLYDVIRHLKVWGKDESWNLEFGSREYVNWAITQIVAAARGLDYAHRKGIVHRDVKPANILVDRDSHLVKVADFGLAVDPEGPRITTVGTVMGTVAYMAPEQIRGQLDQIGPWTDVYALGVTLFELLTLDLPYSGATQQLYMSAVLTAQAKRPRKINERVSHDLEIVLQKALEKAPQDRYASAGALADDLENVAHFRPILARPPAAGTRLVKWARRKPMHAALILALATGIPALSFLSYRALLHQRLVERLDTEQEKEAVRRLDHDYRFREALPILDKVLERHPDDPDALRTRAVTRFRLAAVDSDPERQAESRKLALADASRLVLLEPDASWPYRLRAFLEKEFGRTAEAARDESAAQAKRSAEPSSQELDIDGVLAMEAGSFKEAVEIYTKIIVQHPDASEAQYFRAMAYQNLGESAKAMTGYEVASALAPSDPIPRINLGQLLNQAGDLGRAEAELRKALSLDPKSAAAYECLADNLILQAKQKAAAGDREAARRGFKEAEGAARQSLRLDDERAWAHANLGVALVEQNRLAEASNPALIEEATREYTKAIRLAEASKGSESERIMRTALANECDALMQLGDIRLALASCERIADLEPAHAINQYNLAAVYALTNRSADALAALAKDFDLGDRDWQSLATDKSFDSIRGDRRFTTLMNKMKATPSQVPQPSSIP